MYCMNCGRENPEGVKFCCFCGASANIAPDFVEEKTDKISENPAENGQLDFDENEVSAQNPANVSAPVSPIAPVSGISANPYAYPQPLPINTQGVSCAPRTGQNVQNVNIPMKNDIPEEKQDFERKYTIKHIIMCLVSTAVCAIAAGVFAGLYFSVV